MRWIISTWIAIALFAGCASPPSTELVTKLPGELSKIEEDIIELLIREKEHVPWAKGDFRVNVIFLSIEGKDPTDALVSRLNQYRPVVAASVGKGSVDGVFHPQTGERGEGVAYSNIRWKSRYSVELDFNHFIAGLAGNFGKGEVAFENGSWKVVRWQILGES